MLGSILFSPLSKVVDFLPVWTLIIVYNMTNDGGAVCTLHNRVLWVSGSAVMGVQCEQEGAEHTALGGSGVEH